MRISKKLLAILLAVITIFSYSTALAETTENEVEPAFDISMHRLTLYINNDQYITTSNLKSEVVAWESSDMNIFTVDHLGKLSGVKPGQAVLTVRTGDGETCHATINVEKAKVKEIRITASKFVGDIGDTLEIDTTILPSYSYNKALYWASSNAAVAKVDGNGTITLVGKGVANVSVKAASGVKRIIQVYSGYNFDSVHYHQGDSAWRFGSFAKKACVVTSTAILATNATNETITPRDIKNLGGNLNRIKEAYGIEAVSALPAGSKYLKKYDAKSHKTTVNNPRKNAEAAIKEALALHPEGVMCYFVGRGGKHMVVAIGVGENGKIYYSDPGRVRSKGFEVPLSQTWCSVGNGCGYGQLNYMLAFDTVQ